MLIESALPNAFWLVRVPPGANAAYIAAAAGPAARVVDVDMFATAPGAGPEEGVVHLIDGVLLPPTTRLGDRLGFAFDPLVRFPSLLDNAVFTGVELVFGRPVGVLGG